MSELPELPPAGRPIRPLPAGGLEAVLEQGRRRRTRALLGIGGTTGVVALVLAATVVLPRPGLDTLDPADPPRFASSPAATPTDAAPSPEPSEAPSTPDPQPVPTDEPPSPTVEPPVARPTRDPAPTSVATPPADSPAPRATAPAQSPAAQSPSAPPPASPSPSPEPTSSAARTSFRFDSAARGDRPEQVVVGYGDPSSCPSREVRHQVREDGGQVVVTLTRVADRDEVCTADYRPRFVQVQLQAPLAGRAVVDGSRGESVPVSG